MSRSDPDDLRALRKRLLIAESMLMRERLARDIRESTRPVRLLRESLVAAASTVPGRSLLGFVVPWLYSRWRRKPSPTKENSR